tara:strand:+ start:110 stop:1645 length:1536 start_codon:yes stop_codon:yes gene_type:complete
MNTNINFHKWNKKDSNNFLKSCNNILDIKQSQFYQPYFSLYFHLHNTKKSHKCIDLKRRYYIQEILEITNKKYHTSNIFAKCKIYDSDRNIYTIEEVFCKCIPLLDPLYFIMSNYNNFVHRNPLLPSCYNYNTFEKINNMNNNAYIDTFLSFICSELVINNVIPSFPIYYGSVNGIKNNFNFDISDDYYSLKQESWFHKNLYRFNIKVDMYVSSDDEDNSDSCSDDIDDNISDDIDDNISDDISDDIDDNSEYSSKSLSTTSSNSDSNNDYIILLNKLPVQTFFIEKLQGTLEDLLGNIDDIKTDVILSCIFQVSFALNYMQKHYSFTHNDLHINNIMYTSTSKTYLYYKFNNIYFKIPTYGYLFKIIDFGRAIFTFHNRLFFNDTFEKHGEAEGQYSKPFNKLNFKENKIKIEPNYNFDLCRLSITILDVCNYDKNVNYKSKQSFIDFIYNMTLTGDCESLYDLDDDFNMYISIAKFACNSLPKNIIQNIIFNKFRIKKKEFPKRSYYNC